MASVLAKIEDGAAVLTALRQVRDEVTGAATTSSGVLDIIIRQFCSESRFACDRCGARVRQAMGGEAQGNHQDWRHRRIPRLPPVFPEAGGVIPISTGAENAVRLMTAHVAKGLEFNHVFIIRANSNSFPSSYKEPLVDFPRELQGAGSMPRSTTRNCAGRKSAACSMLP